MVVRKAAKSAMTSSVMNRYDNRFKFVVLVVNTEYPFFLKD